MENLFLEFELDCQIADNLFETARDKFNISVVELTMLKNQGYFTESEDDTDIYTEAVSKYLESIKDFFKKILDSIKNLVTNVNDKIKVEMQKKEVNKKLKKLKEQLAKEKSIYRNGKVKYFDTAKYIKEYTKYINLMVSENKKLYSKEYKSVDEYQAARKKCIEKLDKFFMNSKLYDGETFYIENAVSNCIEYTEKEIASQNSVNNAYRAAWEKAVKEFQNMAEKEDDEAKINDIKQTTNSFTSKCSSAFKKIVNAPFEKLGIIKKSLSSASV